MGPFVTTCAGGDIRQSIIEKSSRAMLQGGAALTCRDSRWFEALFGIAVENDEIGVPSQENPKRHLTSRHILRSRF